MALFTFSIVEVSLSWRSGCTLEVLSDVPVHLPLLSILVFAVLRFHPVFVIECLFELARVIKVSKIYSNCVKKAQNHANNEAYPPKNVINIFLLPVGRFLLLIGFESIQWGVILLVMNVLNHLVHTKSSTLVMLFQRAIFHGSRFKFLAVYLTEEVKRFHNTID